jgi:hypothetical protein
MINLEEELATKITKLPRWAQQHIDHLRRQLTETQLALREAQGGVIETDTVADPYGEYPQNMRPGTTIRFLMNGNYLDCIMHERHGSNRLEVRGSEALTIRPSSSNVLTVDVGRNCR